MLQVAELEAQLGHPAAAQTGREELSRSLEELEALLSAKNQARYQFAAFTAYCPNPFTIVKGTSELFCSTAAGTQQYVASNSLAVLFSACGYSQQPNG